MTTKISNQNTRNIFFTLNNPTEGEEELLKNWNAIKRIVFQLEEGEINKTPHFQGYAEFKYPLKFSSIKNYIDRIHIEKRLSTTKNCYDYCTKLKGRLKEPVIIGNWEKEKKETKKKYNLEIVLEKINNGFSLLDIQEENPIFFAKNKKTIFELFSNYMNKMKFNSKRKIIVVVSGKSGIGKTTYFTQHRYKNNARDCNCIIKSNQSLWLDSYIGQKYVLIDEFNGWIPKHLFLTITNSEPCELESKGGRIWFNPELIYICSNKHPIDWYNWEDDKGIIDTYTRDAFLRRITHLIFVDRESNEFKTREDFWKFLDEKLILEKYRPDLEKKEKENFFTETETNVSETSNEINLDIGIDIPKPIKRKTFKLKH